MLPVPQTGTRSLLRRFNLALAANKKIATVGAVFATSTPATTISMYAFKVELLHCVVVVCVTEWENAKTAVTAIDGKFLR